MGFSTFANAGVVERTGAERATLVRRTYSLVLANVVITMLGAATAFAVPSLMQAVARHPFLSFICMLVPLFMAQWTRTRFPLNLMWVTIFAFLGIGGVWLWFFIHQLKGQTIIPIHETWVEEAIREGALTRHA